MKIMTECSSLPTGIVSEFSAVGTTQDQTNAIIDGQYCDIIILMPET